MNDSAAKIKVDRSWVGAPDSALVGNPTVWLFIGAWATLALTATYHLQGALPVAPTVALNAIAFYVLFTVMHDSVHRTAHRSRFVNATLGRLSAFTLTVTLPLFRAARESGGPSCLWQWKTARGNAGVRIVFAYRFPPRAYDFDAQLESP